MFNYTTEIKRRYITKPVITNIQDLLKPVTQVEKKYLNTLEVTMQESINNREDLRGLINELYPEIAQLLQADKQMGLRIASNSTIIKTIVNSGEDSYMIFRKILPSYVANIEQKLSNNPNNGDSCM